METIRLRPRVLFWMVHRRRAYIPRAGPLMAEFADHLAADVNQVTEDEQTGQKSYRYVRTATNHYSLAFTYDTIAWSRDTWIDWSQYGWLRDDDEEPRGRRFNMRTSRF